MRYADFVSIGDDVVKQGDGFVIALLVDAVIGTGQTVEFHARIVHFQVVFDNERQSHSIIGYELGGGGFQHFQLALGPFVLADEIAQLGVFEAGFVTQWLFFQTFVDLAIEQRSFPHFILVKVDVGQFQFQLGLTLFVVHLFYRIGKKGNGFIRLVKMIGHNVGLDQR